MLFPLLRYYYQFKPRLLGWMVKLFLSHSKFRIGTNFQCDSFPRIVLDKGAEVVIGDNVLFRRNVEIRAHGKASVSIGNNCRIDRGVRILAANNAKIILEEGVRMGLYTVLNGGDSIFIGRKSLISGFVYLQTSMHNYQGQMDIQAQGYTHEPIEVGDDCWLGTHVVIFPGVCLGKKCVVGSNSVVTKSFLDNTVLTGIPASKLKERAI